MLLIPEVNALALQDFKNVVDSRVVIPERGLSLRPALSLGIPHSSPSPVSLTSLAACFYLHPTSDTP